MDWAYSTALMSKTQPLTRHLISINDLTNAEIETIFEVANGFLKELADPKIHYRIGRSTDLAAKSILASLFYEPSTRTRLSFESAMLRLGGANITSADPAVSSAAKGESLADTIRVISNYADIVVIRHPRDGAARLGGRIFANSRDQRRRRQPRASDADIVRPVHAALEEEEF